jgi:hypothetical protein
MMKLMTRDSTPREFQRVYRMGDVVYVPHFRNGDVYVGPGYPRFTKQRYSEFELVSKGAIQESMPLWTRGRFGIVDDANL